MLLKFPITGSEDRNILVSCTDYEIPYVMVRVITFVFSSTRPQISQQSESEE